jgi:hypothetical protein
MDRNNSPKNRPYPCLNQGIGEALGLDQRRRRAEKRLEDLIGWTVNRPSET